MIGIHAYMCKHLHRCLNIYLYPIFVISKPQRIVLLKMILEAKLDYCLIKKIQTAACYGLLADI